MYKLNIDRPKEGVLSIVGTHINKEGKEKVTIANPDFPESDLYLLASCFIKSTEELKIEATQRGSDAAERLLEIIQRVQTPEFLGGGTAVLNYIDNLGIIDKFDFNVNQGRFTNKGVIFCGAGPSLHTNIDSIMSSGLFVIAGGSAISYFARKGIKPDAVVACDPNPTESVRFNDIPDSWTDVPLIYKGTLNPEALSKWPGKKYYITGTGEKSTQLLEGGKLYLCHESISVTTVALMICNFLGADRVYLAGVDLGETEDLYPEAISDLAETEDLERREESFKDERKLISSLAAALDTEVVTLSTELDNVKKVDTFNHSEKISLIQSTFKRTYWRQLRRKLNSVLRNLNKITSNGEISYKHDIEDGDAVKYLLEPLLNVAMNRLLVSDTLDLNPLHVTAKKLIPKIKRILK